MIYCFKSLKLGSKALCQTTTGHVVNLVANDTEFFEIFALYSHFLYVGPLVFLISTGIFGYVYGLTGLLAAIVLLSLIPIQSMPMHDD